MLPDRLTLIDDTSRAYHPYLDAGDRCFYFGEYFAGKSYRGGPTNQLIFNFKCKPTTAAANPVRGSYKSSAVQTIADGLRRAISQQNAERYTWVPIPPSKMEGDTEYDDRMLRTLKRAFQGYEADVRPLLRQTGSTVADHEQEDRLTRDALRELLEVDREALGLAPVRAGIILVDDVLASGKHFKCCEHRLHEALPAVQIAGVFVARCVWTSPINELEVSP